MRWIEKSKESHQLEIYNIQLSSEEIGRKNIEFYQRDLALNYVSGDEVINRELSQAIASFKNENQELREKDKGRDYELKQLKKMIKKLQKENSDLKGR
jgi:parvulin-like peptidyl-prolyl isomerase